MKIMHDIIILSHLKPLNSQKNETNHTKLWHINEKVLLKNQLKDRNMIHNLLDFNLHEIYDVGIVMNEKKTCIKIIADFLAEILTSTI